MEYHHSIVLMLLSCSPMFFFFFFFFMSSSVAAVDTISANQPIKDKDGNTIVSHGEMYELGFFSPGNSKNRYLGIWYKKISPRTAVWVANRETPISDASGAFELSSKGKLSIVSGGDTIIWSSDLMVSAPNPVVQLLDNGNLVVWENSTKENNPIWQSFDYPGNTLLPGMKFGKDLTTGRERYLTSWKSPDDPSIGVYKLWVDTNGYPQLFMRKGIVVKPYVRVGPWNGLGFRGRPIENDGPIFFSEFIVHEKEVYYIYKLKTNSVIYRISMTHDGIIMHSNWVARTQEWVVYANVVVDTCALYGRCGPNGRCSTLENPLCSCIEGFEPRFLEEWNEEDMSNGCQRKKPLSCGTQDVFHKISGVKFPDTRNSWYDVSMSRGECEMACRRNCSCTAYADLDIRSGGSGCLLWFGELMDIKKYDDDHQELFIKMANSELPEKGQSGFNKKNKVLIIVISVSSVALLLSAIAYACRKRKKRPHKKGRGNKGHTFDKESVQMENFDEIPFVSLYRLAKATDNFNIANKIGEGGFGPVYKGVLEYGQVIAVKRLSETSQQGLEEFQNEVICIAKLQHRNLVKLLGYCIHGNEKILIYEYMDNKSLDSFLFDENRSSMLDWPQRFNIIQGMAQGILYLHQDSRLQIIHRDLKAGNILLDSQMNPKISDFGLARKFVGHDAMAKTRKVVGTYGYISPEYAVHGRFSIKSDVFSFGVLVLEIVSGMKNRGFSHEAHSDSLLGHAWRLYKEDKSIELMSASLRTSCVASEIQRSIHVGLLCVQHQAEDRPTMLAVVLMLMSEGVLPPPKQPSFFTEEIDRFRNPVPSFNDDYMITLLYPR